MEAYTYLAQVYDALMYDVDASKWAEYLDVLLKKHGVKRVLDCACGTGSITRALEDLGYGMIASDVSENMLKTAQKAARESGSSIMFIKQDMRDIAVGNLVDAVISTCDGVNYIDMDGVKRFAASSFAALNKGGVLMFDISTRHKLKDEMDGELFYDDSDDAACIWSNAYDCGKDALIIDITLFVRRGALFERVTEQHVQYAHEENVLKTVLLDAGFARIDVFDCFSMEKPKSESVRVQFVCVKG